MKHLVRIFSIFAALTIAAAGCQKDNSQQSGGKDIPEEPVTEPAPCKYKIAAHRGGSGECGQPDNSRMALKYAMSLKIYASECDVYWTKDNNIIIGHSDSDYRINSMHPWEHTLEEIRKAGTLENGESYPSLDDFIDLVMTKGNCTRLWLDLKWVNPEENTVKAYTRACEIIKNRHAEKFCEFILTGNTRVAATVSDLMKQPEYQGINVGWMGNLAPSYHLEYGFTWSNLSVAAMDPTEKNLGPTMHSVDEFVNAGLELSVFNVDMPGGQNFGGVNSEVDVAYYLKHYDKMKAICTNYPKWLKSRL